MRRRDFIILLGNITAIPFVAHAEQGERVRVIGVLLPAAADDPVFEARLAAFYQELALLGWSIGRNVRVDVRWATTNPAEIRRHATELAALNPDVILSTGDSTVPPLLQATRTVPIVFPVVNDPLGAGYVESLARPGGNVTGFMLLEYSSGVKWLELLKEIAPNVTRVAVLRDSANPAQTAQFGVIQAVSPMFKVEAIPVDMRDAGEIERAAETFARSPNGGLIVVGSGASIRYRDLIVALAARHKLPAVYWERFFVVAGGLISYGAQTIDQYRRAAGYVDRILKGEKPADLPVQASTKYETAINLTTAKALGLSVPLSVQQRADDGTKRTSLVAPNMSAFGGRADMTFCGAYVCFGPIADMPATGWALADCIPA
ncbi:MAG: ABC transporter substrate-binding protein [Pseudolabrys sp.]